jgi:hypothetical protein
MDRDFYKSADVCMIACVSFEAGFFQVYSFCNDFCWQNFFISAFCFLVGDFTAGRIPQPPRPFESCPDIVRVLAWEFFYRTQGGHKYLTKAFKIFVEWK